MGYPRRIKKTGRQVGLVRDTHLKTAHLSAKTEHTLDSIAKVMGVQVQFAPTVNNGTANAQYKDGVITIALNAQDPVGTAFTHELVHGIRAVSPEAYASMKRFVVGNMSKASFSANLLERAQRYGSADMDAMDALDKTSEHVSISTESTTVNSQTENFSLKDTASQVTPDDAHKVRGSLEGGRDAIKNALLNIENATISPKKLTEYALNPGHPVGGNKAKVFESTLGYNQSNADDLLKRVYEKLPENEATLGVLDKYGQRYTVDMPITGPNGNTKIVRTGWIFKSGSTKPELTTIYVK